jgi:hypothetical protein
MRRDVVLNRGAVPQTLPVTTARDPRPARRPQGCACSRSVNRKKTNPEGVQTGRAASRWPVMSRLVGTGPTRRGISAAL